MNAIAQRASTQAAHSAWIDDYCLLRPLEDGGMAQVYLAYDMQTQQQVAIKLVENGQFDEGLFAREVRSMRSLDHPSILPLLAARRSGRWSYLVTPYIAGGTLQDRMDDQTLTFDEITSIFQQLTDALEHMHARGIIHRDIKPTNILLDGNNVYLADFGIASWQREEFVYFDEPMMGTPVYMAPEIYEGQVSRQGDLYALGAVLYQMLTGEVPFDDKDSNNIYWKQKTTRPFPPSFINPNLSPALEQVILRALEKEPRDRFQTAADLALAYRQATAPSLLERMTTTFTDMVHSINLYCSGTHHLTDEEHRRLRGTGVAILRLKPVCAR